MVKRDMCFGDAKRIVSSEGLKKLSFDNHFSATDNIQNLIFLIIMHSHFCYRHSGQSLDATRYLRQ